MKRRKVPESVVEAVGLSAKLVDDAVVTLLSAVDLVGPRSDELTGSLASANGKIIFSTLKCTT